MLSCTDKLACEISSAAANFCRYMESYTSVVMAFDLHDDSITTMAMTKAMELLRHIIGRGKYAI